MKNNFPRIYVSAETRRKMVEIAREFRKEPTTSEKILWEALRGKKLDRIKFRRQQPVGYFVVDFYSSEYRLVVEVDGPIHERQKDADQARQEILEEVGLTVVRVSSVLVESNLSIALKMIRNAIHQINENKKGIPSPFMGEGEGGG